MAAATMAPSLRYMSPRQPLELPMTKLYWPVGLAAPYDPALAVGAEAIADGVLPHDTFDATQPCPVHICVNAGDGFREVLCWTAGPNGNGLSYLWVEVGGRPIREVMLRCFDGPAGVRVDWPRLTFSLQGSAETAAVCLERPEDFAQLRFQGAVALSDSAGPWSDRSPGTRLPVPYRVDVVGVQGGDRDAVRWPAALSDAASPSEQR